MEVYILIRTTSNGRSVSMVFAEKYDAEYILAHCQQKIKYQHPPEDAVGEPEEIFWSLETHKLRTSLEGLI